MKSLKSILVTALIAVTVIVFSNCRTQSPSQPENNSAELWRDCTTVSIDTFRIVTWNVKDIFTASDVSARQTDLRQFANVLDPDIIMLEEFTSLSVLNQIKDAMDLEGYFTASSDFAEGSGRGSFEVGVISRFPITSVTEYDPFPEAGDIELTSLTEFGISDVGTSRGFIVAQIEALNLYLVPIHLKSSLGEVGEEDADNARKREKVVCYIAKIISEMKSTHPDSYFLVAGDFNVGHSDILKNGTDLLHDCYSNCEGSDLYDETHALLGGGLISNLQMINLARDISESTYPDYPGSPIDNIYIDGRDRTSFRKAFKIDQTFGSDHTPVYTEFSPGSNLFALEVADQPVVGEGSVRIIRLLPNPPGDETINESATMKNFSDHPVNLSGWQLRDDENTTLPLNTLGTLAAGEEKTILRNGASLAMANGGDIVMLVDPDGNIVQQVQYSNASQGVEIEF